MDTESIRFVLVGLAAAIPFEPQPLAHLAFDGVAIYQLRFLGPLSAQPDCASAVGRLSSVSVRRRFQLPTS